MSDAPLGSAANPIRGPEPEGFAGPDVNYSPSKFDLDRGVPPLGDVRNPLRNPDETSGLAPMAAEPEVVREPTLSEDDTPSEEAKATDTGDKHSRRKSSKDK